MIWNIAPLDEEVVKMHERTFKTLELWCQWDKCTVRSCLKSTNQMKTVHLISVSNLKIKLTELATVDLARFAYKIND